MVKRIVGILVCIFIGFAILVGGIRLLASALEDKPTAYEGKTVYEWATALHSSDPTVVADARATVTNRVIPALAEKMFHDTNDPPLKLKLVESLNSLPGMFISTLEAPSRRYEAARSFGEFGADAAPAVPDLIRCVQGQDAPVRPGAIESLGKIGAAPETVVPLLIQCLDDPDEDIKVQATEALGEFGPRARAAVPKLVPLLKFRSKELPPAAQKSLRLIDPNGLAATSTNGSGASPSSH